MHNERDLNELTDVRNSANKLEIGKMLPSAGLKTKMHSGASNVPKQDAAKKAVSEKKDAEKSFQWGP